MMNDNDDNDDIDDDEETKGHMPGTWTHGQAGIRQ